MGVAGEAEADSVWAWAAHARQISRAEAASRQDEGDGPIVEPA